MIEGLVCVEPLGRVEGEQLVDEVAGGKVLQVGSKPLLHASLTLYKQILGLRLTKSEKYPYFYYNFGQVNLQNSLLGVGFNKNAGLLPCSKELYQSSVTIHVVLGFFYTYKLYVYTLGMSILL